MKYAQIERKPFPYFFVDVSGGECYSVDVRDAHQKNLENSLPYERRKQYEQSKTLVCSCAGGIDAVRSKSVV